jgi:phosphoribosylglycinamide formyltransferase-1
MNRLAVLASGRGSNFQAIIDHVQLGVLENVDIGLLISNESTAPALLVAKNNSIPSVIIEGIRGKKFNNANERELARNRFDEEAVSTLENYSIDTIVLAGFMQVLGKPILRNHKYRVMNIHPALDLRRFGGRGMYGERVHTAVLQAGETKSGCTVHYVNESIDGGPIILQTPVQVQAGDTPVTLARRILIQEHRTYSKAIQLQTDNRIDIRNCVATIDWSNDWETKWNRRQTKFIRVQEERMLEDQATAH